MLSAGAIRSLLLSCVAFGIAVLAGCQSPAITPVNGVATLEIPAASGSDAAKADAKPHPVALKPSDRLRVLLNAPSGTGYVWQLAGSAPAVLNSNGIITTGPAATPDSAKPAPAGAPTCTTFEFLAIAQGEGDLRFVLRRPWEVPPNGVARTVNVPVTVAIDKQASKN